MKLDFPLFETLTYQSNKDWQSGRTNLSISSSIQVHKFIKLLGRHENESTCKLKNELDLAKNAGENISKYQIYLEVNVYNWVHELSIPQNSTFFVLSGDLKYKIKLTQEDLAECLRCYVANISNLINFRSSYQGMDELYHKNLRHLTERIHKVCCQLYIYSDSGPKDSEYVDKKEAGFWSKTMELIRMHGYNESFEGTKQKDNYSYKDEHAIFRDLSHRKNAWATITEIMNETDEYDITPSYETFFIALYTILPFDRPTNMTFSAKDLNEFSDNEPEIHHKDHLYLFTTYGDFLEKDQVLANKISQFSTLEDDLDALLDLFPEIYASYLENYSIDTENRHHLMKYWHCSLVKIIKIIKNNHDLIETEKLEKDIILYLIGQVISSPPTNTMIAMVENKNTPVIDNTPTLKEQNTFHPSFHLKHYPDYACIEIAKIKGLVIQVSNSRIYTNLTDFTCWESYIYYWPDYRKILQLSSPTIRLKKRLELRNSKTDDSTQQRINFHQDYDKIYNIGFMGFHCGYEQDITSNKVKKVKQIKKIGVCDGGEVIFYDIDKDSILTHQKRSYYLKHANAFDTDITHSYKQIEKWSLDSPKASEVFTQIKQKLNSITFSQSYAREYLTLWIMGTYFYRVFPQYPKVVINDLPGQDSQYLMVLISKLSFNGRAISEDDRDTKSLTDAIHIQSPTLCIYTHETRSTTKRSIVELLNYSSVHRDIKTLNPKGATDLYCPIIHSLNRFDVSSNSASGDSINLDIKAINTRQIQMDIEKISHELDTINHDSLKSWAISSMNNISNTSNDINRNSNINPRDLAIRTIAQATQACGIRNLTNVVTTYEEIIFNQLNYEIKESVETALVHTLLTSKRLWRKELENVFIPSDSLKNKMKSGAPKKVKDQTTSEALKKIFMAHGLLESDRISKSTRNDLSSMKCPNPKNGFQMNQHKLKTFAEALGRDMGFINKDGSLKNYCDEAE